ncbi:hypothetical protein AA0312_2609 [Acetobacter tropicalis NRIC 0312]|uniref:Uncharacterized protein n=1 Tax=Acetobacter tropicalis TaxID=104102 RepID=A0A511FNI1_9PROT|nr:hypothetical protein ATR1_039d0071 [Acetobacter tropicalis]GBR71950.1 hypothetical protein AA0312_2609 [Acetobacter tropicalis NRIC 0312]GEL50506.1 hypothetical protein ATR01nite_15810 [Acetobacter tropicalis]
MRVVSRGGKKASQKCVRANVEQDDFPCVKNAGGIVMTKTEKEKKPSKKERELDESLKESFPASDPPSQEDPDKKVGR